MSKIMCSFLLCHMIKHSAGVREDHACNRERWTYGTPVRLFEIWIDAVSTNTRVSAMSVIFTVVSTPKSGKNFRITLYRGLLIRIFAIKMCRYEIHWQKRNDGRQTSIYRKISIWIKFVWKSEVIFKKIYLFYLQYISTSSLCFRRTLWSWGKMVTSHILGPDSIPSRVNSLVEVLSWVFRQP